MLADTLPIHETPAGEDDAHAFFAACYRDLRRVARAQLRAGGRDALLDTTVLVHEAYLRLSQSSGLRFPDRARFMVYAGRAMRSVIVDFARKRLAERRGGDLQQVTMTAQFGAPAVASDPQVVRVHEALQDLEKIDARMVQVVEMKYFAGLTENEIAAALGITDRTVRRDWEQARLFLADALA